MTNFLSSNLKYLRQRFNVSQSLLSRQVGKAQTTIGNWENRVSKPDVEETSVIASYFGVSVDDLLNTDLSTSGLITDERVSLFVKVRPPGGRKIKAYSAAYPTSELHEAESGPIWQMMELLKKIDWKLDQVLGGDG
jgi:transcriptional regulator with XRE-family HTH domain